MYTVYKTTRLRTWRLDVCIFVSTEVICVTNSSANWGGVPIDVSSLLFGDKNSSPVLMEKCSFSWKNVVHILPSSLLSLTHILITNMTIFPTRAESPCSPPSLWNWTPEPCLYSHWVSAMFFGRNNLFFLQRFLWFWFDIDNYYMDKWFSILNKAVLLGNVVNTKGVVIPCGNTWVCLNFLVHHCNIDISIWLSNFFYKDEKM